MDRATPMRATAARSVHLFRRSQGWRSGRRHRDSNQTITKLVPARTKLQPVAVAARHLRNVLREAKRIEKYFQHASIRYAV